jgi:tetratricopeptide (TPR) repeat protein
VEHILYGDLKIEAKPDAALPLSFVVLLRNINGLVIDRTIIPNNGRYRFMKVPNGEYEIVVEAESRELASVSFLLLEKRATDIRKDLLLEWKSDSPAARAKPGLMSVRDMYPRSSANAELMDKAMAASAIKNYREAAMLLEQIVGADPKDFEAWTELGTAHFMQGDKGEAEKAYKRALGLRPSYPVALLNLARLQFSQKNYEAVIQTSGQLTALHPESAEAHRLLGEAYLQTKKGSKAVPELEEALRLDPAGQAEAHLRLAALYNAAGYKNLAAAQYEQFLAKRPDYPEKKKLQEYIRQNKP